MRVSELRDKNMAGRALNINVRDQFEMPETATRTKQAATAKRQLMLEFLEMTEMMNG